MELTQRRRGCISSNWWKFATAFQINPAGDGRDCKKPVQLSAEQDDGPSPTVKCTAGDKKVHRLFLRKGRLQHLLPAQGKVGAEVKAAKLLEALVRDERGEQWAGVLSPGPSIADMEEDKARFECWEAAASVRETKRAKWHHWIKG